MSFHVMAGLPGLQGIPTGKHITFVLQTWCNKLDQERWHNVVASRFKFDVGGSDASCCASVSHYLHVTKPLKDTRVFQQMF